MLQLLFRIYFNLLLKPFQKWKFEGLPRRDWFPKWICHGFGQERRLRTRLEHWVLVPCLGSWQRYKYLYLPRCQPYFQVHQYQVPRSPHTLDSSFGRLLGNLHEHKVNQIFDHCILILGDSRKALTNKAFFTITIQWLVQRKLLLVVATMARPAEVGIVSEMIVVVQLELHWKTKAQKADADHQ